MKMTAASLYSALSHEIRLRTLLLLQSQGELCVCELTHALGLSQPMISRHLALLREAGLVVDRRAGIWIYYAINPALPDWARTVLSATQDGTRQQSPFRDDLASLKDMPNRPSARCCA
ncbi:MAG: metalloregulator ArsR/SmtB family transcription factor [Gammaproteobacteria bacterium]|jgi:ArsR family transcriptional regulator, arsenate/arsenite/antimonite-responsive transcriptional repressor